MGGYRCNSCGAFEVQGHIAHRTSCPHHAPVTSRALLDLEAWIAAERKEGRTPSTACELEWLADQLDLARAPQPEPDHTAEWEADTDPPPATWERLDTIGTDLLAMSAEVATLAERPHRLVVRTAGSMLLQCAQVLRDEAHQERLDGMADGAAIAAAEARADQAAEL